MIPPPRAPTLSLVLLGASVAEKPPVGLARAVAEGWAVEIERAAASSFEQLASAFAAAVGRCGGDYVMAVTPDLRLADDGWRTLAAALAADPDADGLRLSLRGLLRDAGWRGRRCRSHLRNLESLRFANIVAPGALVVRRGALAAALAEVPANAGADWWRLTALQVARSGRVAELDIGPRRSTLLEREPLHPGYAPPQRPRVLVFGQIEVSASLYFDALEGDPAFEVSFRALTRLGADAMALASADLVILVRELHRFWDEGVIEFLTAAKIPYVWFADDNFLALRREGAAAAFYAEPRMRAALSGAVAIWASTPALAASHVWLHPRVEVWGPQIDRALWVSPPPASGPLTIAVPGGDFRLDGLGGEVMEQLVTLSDAGELRLLLTAAGAVKLRPALPRAEIIPLPQERSFRQHIRQWRRFAPDILLHPTGATANAPYKAPTAAISAGYLGAVAVVGDEPAYESWREAEGVLRLAALSEAAAKARDVRWRVDMAGRLGVALTERFGGEGRVKRLTDLARRPARRKIEALAQNILDAPAFNRRRAALRAAHLTRRLRDRLKPPE